MVAGRATTWESKKTTRGALLDQHRAIVEALLARDPEGARQAVVDHLTYVESCLADNRKAEAHEVVARQRLEHVEGKG